MKNLSLSLALTALVLLSSCVVVHKDNGRHRGHYKHKRYHHNRNNPHHPATTNPGRGHGR